MPWRDRNECQDCQPGSSRADSAGWSTGARTCRRNSLRLCRPPHANDVTHASTPEVHFGGRCSLSSSLANLLPGMGRASRKPNGAGGQSADGSVSGPEAEAEVLGAMLEAEDLATVRARRRARVEIGGEQQGLRHAALRHSDGGIASCLRETDGLADEIRPRGTFRSRIRRAGVQTARWCCRIMPLLTEAPGSDTVPTTREPASP